MKINIAIDGPTAAGKSTIALKLANLLNYIHVDTGAMYRVVAYKARSLNIPLDDETAVCDMLKKTDIVLSSDGSIYLDSKKCGNEIRTNELSLAASDVSKLKKVREDLVFRQKEMAKDKGYIMDGRDIGTVVLPNAELKLFLTASAAARATRRHLQNIEKNIPSDFEVLKKEIEKRDYQDSNRANSPLKQAEDAILIDSSDCDIENVIEQIVTLLKSRGVIND